MGTEQHCVVAFETAGMDTRKKQIFLAYIALLQLTTLRMKEDFKKRFYDSCYGQP
jgi:hypothetical protein